MTTRGREQAEMELGELFDEFAAAVDAGNRHFWAKYGEDSHRITSIARAGLIRCLVADELKKRIDGRPKVLIEERHQTTQFYFGHNWVIQVHKLDESNRRAMNDTQRCLDLDENNAQPCLIPGATVLYLGYIENVGDHVSPELRLTCPGGDAPVWVIDLGAASTPPPPTEITPPDVHGSPSDGTKVVVRRKDRKFSH